MSVGNHFAVSVHAAPAPCWPTLEYVGPVSSSSGAQCVNTLTLWAYFLISFSINIIVGNSSLKSVVKSGS